MIRLIVIMVILAICVTIAALGQSSTRPAVEADLETQLSEIDRRAAAITDLSAEFVQLKHTPLLKKPLESKGTLRVKGDQMRWDTESPSPGVMTIDAVELRVYSPDQRQLEIYPMQNGLGQIAASPVPRLTVVREHFLIERIDWPQENQRDQESNDRLAIRLTPRDASFRKHVREVRVLLHMDSGCAQVVRIIDPDDDELEITFSNLRINPGLRDDQVRFDPPKGTVISRPLESGPGVGDQR